MKCSICGSEMVLSKQGNFFDCYRCKSSVLVPWWKPPRQYAEQKSAGSERSEAGTKGEGQ